MSASSSFSAPSLSAQPYHVAMRALMYGVKPEKQPIGETDNRLLRMLARTPTGLVDIDEPGFLRRTGW